MEKNIQAQLKHPWRKRIIIGVASFVLVVAVSLFVWRVSHFVNLIDSGQIMFEDLSFSSDQSKSDILSRTEDLQILENLYSSDDPRLGSDSAKVRIVEFVDFGCPFCQQSSHVIRSLSSKYQDQVQFIIRDFPLIDLHPDAQQAALAAGCAQEQEKYWEYHDKLFLNQNNHSDSALRLYAREINLDESVFAKCLAEKEYEDEIAEDFGDGVLAGVQGTPTYFINGSRVPGHIPQEIFEKIIDQFLNQ